jgi:hypothetical protein
MTEPSVPPAETVTDPAVLVSDGTLSLPRLVEVLRADQARRWRGGGRVLAERYLAAYPTLAASADDALVLIWGPVE